MQALEKALLALERASDHVAREEQFAILARRAHNLKGAAGAAGVLEIQSLSHALEDGLLQLRETRELPEPEQFDLLYAGVDTIRLIGEGDASLRPSDDSLERLEAMLRNILTMELEAPSGDLSPASPSPATPPPSPPPPLPSLPDVSLSEPPPPPMAPSPPMAPPALVEPAASFPSPPALAPVPTFVQAAPLPIPSPFTMVDPTEAATVDAEASSPSEADSPPTEMVEAQRPGGSVAPSSKALPYKALRRDEEDGNARKTSAPRESVALAPMIRVSVEKLDALMNQIGEIITVSKKTEVRLVEMEEIEQQVVQQGQHLEVMRKPLEYLLSHTQSERRQDVQDFFAQLVGMQKGLEERFVRFHRQAMRDAITEGLLTERLPEDIKRLRMRPFSTLEDNMRRTVRDVARRCDKQVNFVLDGLDTEADQGVLDAIRDPLLHLLRNSIDHGIEPEPVRRAAGKDPEGVVRIAFEGRSATLLIRVSDDGRGIDADALRERVLARSLLPEAQLAQLSDREVIDLIFLPGFSTASSVGMVSGRGIGMDVVRQVIQQHHGAVEVTTEVGAGTSFELTMPLTFATVQGIIISVLGHEVAIPIYALERLVRVSRNEIRYIEGTPTVVINDEPLSLINLGELLDLPPITPTVEEEWDEESIYQATSQSLLNAAVIKVGDRRIAFIVDDFVGESEMVVKDIPEVLGRIPNVSGATITWSGKVMVILNPSDLVEAAVRQHTGRAEISWSLDAPTSRRILVCDDSLTTRTLEKNILIAAGYEVEDATNGMEALQLLEARDFQLIVLDVDMPELSGFELTRRLRAQNTYRDIPIILVTSRDAEEDKRRGLAAGADAYITKQAFTQRTFLETVRRFLE